MKQKIKLRGDRSLESKLHRLAYELEFDASRVRGDHPDQESLADALRSISSKLGRLARELEGGE